MEAFSVLPFITSFSRALRDRGLRATPATSIDAVRALGAVDITDRGDVYFALRAVFATRRQDLEPFDEVFAAWWTARGREADRDSAAPREKTSTNPSVVAPWDEPKVGSTSTYLTRWAASLTEAEDDETVPVAAPSPHDTTATKDFRQYDDADLRGLEDAAARIVRRFRSRRSRRWKIARRGPRIDPRRIVRLALATGGDPIRLARRERKLRRTKLVVVCDVSGSMDLYSRFLLQVLYALQHAFARVETFAFSTRLVRITDALASDTYREALDALAQVEGGWSGGTKIGESLESLRAGWPRLFDRRTAIIVLSDGWDTGDPEVLGSALREIHRRAGRVIWLNPLLGSPSYQPLTSGMQAALPYVDVFAPSHDLASLERLAVHLRF
ncbi:MAG TPA: VWA domain-containing protein [Gemmatimonadaceae bacterium]|nr:VWA domain-containing protein [Gemmatimonadaceae bacterium]